ncbi:MAG TPA: MBL fold metallo-hydrolase [Thermoanaerobaculia bacterium]|nr:MBL fold metallo-hydrolase [Thermoanaerobaculia bacterium]
MEEFSTMYFQQYYLSCLAHASYLIGSEGKAAVVDPQRDVGLYLEEAEKEGLAIEWVIETHLHADFVSGHRELAERTGATIVVGRRASVGFPHRAVADGDEIALGSCRLKFLETPGHTPEGISVVVTDLSRSSVPEAVLTGDTLFIGDVGRPDLSNEFTPQELAGMLYESLHGKLLALPDSVEIYPAHGAGSLCGKNISSEKKSTIGREKAFNYALKEMPKDAFVSMMTEGLPPRPKYFALDAEINRLGASPLDALPPLLPLSPEAVEKEIASGALVLDTRSAEAFGRAHVPGSLHIGLSGQFAAWAGTILGLAERLVVVAEDPRRAQEARTRLARVGIENVAGFLEGGVEAWSASGRPIGQVEQIDAATLEARLSSDAPPLVLDVRRPAEWDAGRIAGARLLPLSTFSEEASTSKDVLAAPALAVQCRSGYRSSIASSLLLRAGARRVANVTGGLDAWEKAGLPIERDAAVVAPS